MLDLEKMKLIYQFTKDLKFKDIQVILKAAKTVSHEKKHVLIKSGSITRDVYYLTEGLVRNFYVDDSGKETTYNLFKENQLVFDFAPIFKKEPTRFNFEVLEPIKGYQINYDLIDNIIAEHPKLEFNRKFVYTKIMQEYTQRIESFVLLSPEERYLEFIKEYPDINNRVSDKFIANILGITPVSLSRIRKRIFEKG